MRLSLLFTLAAQATHVLGISSAQPTNVDTEEIMGYTDDQEAQNAMKMTSMPPTTPFNTPRHRAEKAHLKKSMDRSHGTWNPSHPRHRLLDALFAFTQYRPRTMTEVNRWKSLYKNVSKKQKSALEAVVDYNKKLADVEELVYENEVLCKSIVGNALEFYGVGREEFDAHIEEAERAGRVADRVGVAQALKHYVRDWADEGRKEREDAFPCILSMLDGIKKGVEAEGLMKVLLPGSGVGRLGHEVADLGGFEVTVNEWSMYMNVAYRYLESHPEPDSIAVHPFIDSLSHHATTNDLLRKVRFPNKALNPNVLLVEGDFTSAFSNQKDSYDIIVTHFFIDTARNLLSYFDTIHALLKPGGRWINFGPLLYGTGPFVQLSLDEIIEVVGAMGFEFEDVDDVCGGLTFEGKKVRGKEAEYGFNGRALTKNAYLAQAWVAVKK